MQNLDAPIMKLSEIIVGSNVSDEDFERIKSISAKCGVDNVVRNR